MQTTTQAPTLFRSASSRYQAARVLWLFGALLGWSMAGLPVQGQFVSQAAARPQALAPTPSGANLDRLNRPISLTLDRVALPQALEQIAQEGGFKLSYDENLVAGAGDVSLAMEEGTVMEALHAVLEGSPFWLKLTSSGHLIVVERSEPGEAAPEARTARHEVSGTVTSAEDGAPLPGVNIVVKGTAVGTITSVEGTYTLDAPSPDDTLAFSFIGYVSEDVPIQGRSTIDVEMTSDVEALSEVVVVAYGETEQANVTGSVAKVSAENFEEAPVLGFEQALAGKAAGVQVRQSSGVPGGGTEVTIRGLGSINAANSPLYVVDGVPLGNSSADLNNPLNFIAPQDIESVTILKDAASAALYGSRANNGVVLITTKSGGSGQPTITFSSQAGVQAVPGYEKPDLLTAEEYVRFRQESIIDNYIVENGLDVDPDNFQAERPDVFNEIVPEPLRDPARYGEGTDWFDAITETAPFQQYNLSVRGGNEAVQYYVSAGLTDQQGVIRSSGFRRYAFRANIDATITDALRFGVNLTPAHLVQDRAPTDPDAGGFSIWGAVMRARWTLPISPLENENGDLAQSTQVEGLIPGPLTPFFNTSPAYVLENVSDKQINNQVLLSSYLEFEPLANLVLRTTLGVNYRDVNRESFFPSTVAPTSLTGNTPVIPSASLANLDFFNVLNENTLAYNTALGDRHSVEALAGVTLQRDQFSGGFFNGTDFPSDEVQTLNAAPTINGNQDAQEWSLFSYLGRLNYNYDSRYLLTAAFRADASSRFGANNRWGYFPSFSLGWRVSNESFMDGLAPTISRLKLKAGYGETGNNAIGNYAALGQIGTDNYVFGDGFANGRTPTSIPNPNLSWEETRQVDVGFELGLFDDRITLTTDVFNSITTDLLFQVPIARISGFGSTLTNVGRIRNRGVEVVLETQNLRDRALSWNSEFNVSVVRNKVESLGPEGRPIYRGGYGNGTPYTITEVGEPIAQFFGLDLLGLWTEEELDAWVAENGALPYPGAVEGSLKYRDVNGDGQLTTFEDYTVIGTPWPDFTFGITNRLAYRNFNLSIAIDGSVGGDIFDMTRQVNHNIDGVFNLSREVLDRFRPGDDPTQTSVPTTVGQRNRQQWRAPNTASLTSATYLSVRNVTLGYDLGERLLSQVGGVVQGARLSLSVQNALLLSAFDGNPEARKVLDDALVRNVYAGSYPITRTVTLGLNLTF